MGIRFEAERDFRAFWSPKAGDELVGVLKRQVHANNGRSFFIIACETAGLDLRTFDERVSSNAGDLVAVSEFAALRGLGRFTDHRVRIRCTDIREFAEGRQRFEFEVDVDDLADGRDVPF